MPALIPEDANCRTHLWVSGGALVDTVALVTWNRIGNPTFVASSALNFPSGYSAEGLSGFTDTNHYVTSTSNNVLDIAGDFIVSLIARSTHTGNPCYISSGAAGSAGWYIQNYTGNLTLTMSGAGTNWQATPWTADDRVHMITLAKVGTNAWYKIDGQPIQKGALGITYVNPTAYLTYLGRANGTGYGGAGLTVYELYITATTATDTLLNTMHTTVGNWSIPNRYGYTPTLNTIAGPQSVSTSTLKKTATPSGEWHSRGTPSLPLHSRLIEMPGVLNQPGQTFTTGPSVNLWISRVVFRVLKPGWFFGIHSRGNKAHSNYNPGTN